MRMKKTACIVLFIGLSLYLLCGCTLPSSEEKPPEWMWPDTPHVQENEGVVRVSAGLLYATNGDGTCNVKGMGSCEDSDLIIPPVAPNGDRVVAMDAQAFAGCAELISVSLPEGLTQIGNDAFSCCDRLATVHLPDSLRQIGERAFEDCKALSDIHLPAGLVYIGEMAFDGCRRLKTVTFDKPAGWKGELWIEAGYVQLEETVRIPSEELSDPLRAAEALKDTYLFYVWTRK